MKKKLLLVVLFMICVADVAGAWSIGSFKTWPTKNGKTSFELILRDRNWEIAGKYGYVCFYDNKRRLVKWKGTKAWTPTDMISLARIQTVSEVDFSCEDGATSFVNKLCGGSAVSGFDVKVKVSGSNYIIRGTINGKHNIKSCQVSFK